MNRSCFPPPTMTSGHPGPLPGHHLPPRFQKWRWSSALLLLAAGMTLQAAPVTTLKVMQFNVKVNASLGLTAVEQAIKNENPALVTLEEADGYTIQPIAS